MCGAPALRENPYPRLPTGPLLGMTVFQGRSSGGLDKGLRARRATPVWTKS